jgi:hypothetical protein
MLCNICNLYIIQGGKGEGISQRISLEKKNIQKSIIRGEIL